MPKPLMSNAPMIIRKASSVQRARSHAKELDRDHKMILATPSKTSSRPAASLNKNSFYLFLNFLIYHPA